MIKNSYAVSSVSLEVLKLMISILVLLGSYFLLKFMLAIRIIRNRKVPLGFRKFKPYPIDPNEPILTNHFSAKKVQAMMLDQDARKDSCIDFIIIGSGMSGLTSASLLSRLGYKCLVLEQHDRAGGGMHVYEDKGYEFDTGIHYIGRKGYRELVQALQHPDQGTEWARMGTEEDGFTFDQIYLPNGRVVNFKSKPLCYKHLKEEFPGWEAAIDRFEKKVKKAKYLSEIMHNVKTLSIVEWFPFLPWLVFLTLKVLYPWLFKSVYDIVTKITDDKDLQAVLAGNFGNIGMSPKSAMFSLFADMFNHYEQNGGYYPVGGPAEIAKGIIPVIQRAGGKVLVKAEVSEILIKNGKACGVVVKKGCGTHRIISSKGIISSIGLVNIWKLTPVKYRNKICSSNPMETNFPSCQHISIFLGFRGDQKELKLRSSNSWHVCYFNADYKKGYERPLEAKSALALIGFPSAKDPTYNERVPGMSSGMVITCAKFDFFEEWSSQKVKKRDGNYCVLKNEIAEKVLNETLWKSHPELRERVEYIDVGTPLSTAHYLNSWKGASYGLEWSCKRYYQYRARTKIPGLLLTGQDILVCGWASAFFSGVITVCAYLGYNTIPHAICDSNVLMDIMKLLPKLTKEDFLYLKEPEVRLSNATSKEEEMGLGHAPN